MEDYKINEVPERIFLNVGELTESCSFDELEEVTWCIDRVSEHDIEYQLVVKD